MPDAILGVPYEASLAVHAASGALAGAISAISVSSGALPDGLSAATDKLRITGTPTATGLFTFKISLTDSPDTVVESGTFTILVRDVANADTGLSAANKNAADIKRLRLA